MRKREKQSGENRRFDRSGIFLAAGIFGFWTISLLACTLYVQAGEVPPLVAIAGAGWFVWELTELPLGRESIEPS